MSRTTQPPCLNDWLATAVLCVGLGCFTLLGVHIYVGLRGMMMILDRYAEVELPPGAYTNPGPYPHETDPEGAQRTWADLFAACRLTDAWLGSTVDGEPVCYPLAQQGGSR